VTTYSEELASEIKSTLAKYAELSQSLDRTFPGRLVGQSAYDTLSKEALTEKLKGFERKRAQLAAAGLLDQSQDPQFVVPETIDETKSSVLSVYVRDVEKKMGVFDSIAAKIDLFKSIINKRFRHKQMSISKDKGLVFTTDDGQPLQATGLSSGEQHEVVLLYELLFKVRPDTLVLIDEPEISLHIAWQEQFLRDLIQMTKLSQFDVLLATHSPQIISDRWDLTVELRDPLP
jgi:predicted ATP-binding protein involved in virulence